MWKILGGNLISDYYFKKQLFESTKVGIKVNGKLHGLLHL